MPDFWNDLLSGDGFLPHGHCYLWRPALVWLHVVSDSLTALAYISIPFTLLYFVRRRRDLPFHWMFVCFGAFIIACGATHAMEVWTLWNPTYWLAGVIKAVTAAASLPTAVLLIKLVPQALALPSPQQMARADEELRRAHELLERLLDAAPDAMVVVDATGRIVLVNDETEKLFGYPRGELLGQPVDRLVPERLRAAHHEHRARFVAQPTARRSMGGGTLIGLRRDGSEFPAEIRLSPVETRDGVLVSSAIRDVTERDRAEQALRAAKDAAESACSELESFSYSVAHDLRAPLRAMSGYSTTLLEDYAAQLDDDGRGRLDRIVGGARRMSEIIDALLALAKLSRAEARREPVDLGQLGHKVIEQLRATDPGREVEFVAADDLVVHGDPGMLRLALDNLLGNAWKFTAKQPAARIELGREVIAGGVAYFVRDNGAGFDMAYAGKLFAPFKRLHGPAEFAGTGIGLATVQRIVRRHGGRVWAEGAVGSGATFHFTVPAAAGRPRSETLEPALAAGTPAPPPPAAAGG